MLMYCILKNGCPEVAIAPKGVIDVATLHDRVPAARAAIWTRLILPPDANVLEAMRNVIAADDVLSRLLTAVAIETMNYATE